MWVQRWHLDGPMGKVFIAISKRDKAMGEVVIATTKNVELE